MSSPPHSLGPKRLRAHFSTLAMDGVENNLREGRNKGGREAARAAGTSIRETKSVRSDEIFCLVTN